MSDKPITPQEESLLLSLASMFEKLDTRVILDVIRLNKLDLDSCIDHLLTLPIPSSEPIVEEEFEVVPVEPIEDVNDHSLKNSTLQMEPIEEDIQEEIVNDVVENFVEDIVENIVVEASNLASSQPDANESPVSSDPSPNLELSSYDIELNVLPSNDSSSNLNQVDPPVFISDNDDALNREIELQRRIVELEAANARLKTEKSNGMKFVMVQMDGLRATLKEREQQIAQSEAIIADLNQRLQESNAQRSYLENLQDKSKDVIDKAQFVSNYVSEAAEKRLAKIQHKADQIVQSTTEDFWTDNNAVFLNNMRGFVSSVKDMFTGSGSSSPKQQSHAMPINIADDQESVSASASASEEELSDEEKEQDEQARLASLESFAQEQQRRSQ